MKITYFVFPIMFFLTGCASTPIPVSSAAPTPSERLLAFQVPIQGPSGTLVITRDKGLVGSACYFGFFINEVLAARLSPSETARFQVAPGELVLRSGRDPQGRGLCSPQDEWTQRETTLRENEIKHFRLSIDVMGKTDIQRAEPAAAHKPN